MSEVLIAVNSFTTSVGGRTLRVQKGMTVRAGHPLLEGREHFFTDAVDFELEAKPKKAASKKKAEEPVEVPAEEPAGAEEETAADASD